VIGDAERPNEEGEEFIEYHCERNEMISYIRRRFSIDVEGNSRVQLDRNRRFDYI